MTFTRSAGGRFRKENNQNLREVSTVFDLEGLNKAQSRGAICIIRTLKQNPDLKFYSLLLRNYENGQYIVTSDRTVYQQYRGEPKIYSEGDWELIQKIEGYARAIRHESNWGAYIVPPDATTGERFFIGELIEDLVATKFWYTVHPAESAEAVWDGIDLIIDDRSYKVELVG